MQDNQLTIDPTTPQHQAFLHSQAVLAGRRRATAMSREELIEIAALALAEAVMDAETN